MKNKPHDHQQNEKTLVRSKIRYCIEVELILSELEKSDFIECVDNTKIKTASQFLNDEFTILSIYLKDPVDKVKINSLNTLILIFEKLVEFQDFTTMFTQLESLLGNVTLLLEDKNIELELQLAIILGLTEISIMMQELKPQISISSEAQKLELELNKILLEKGFTSALKNKDHSSSGILANCFEEIMRSDPKNLPGEMFKFLQYISSKIPDYSLATVLNCVSRVVAVDPEYLHIAEVFKYSLINNLIKQINIHETRLDLHKQELNDHAEALEWSNTFNQAEIFKELNELSRDSRLFNYCSTFFLNFKGFIDACNNAVNGILQKNHELVATLQNKLIKSVINGVIKVFEKTAEIASPEIGSTISLLTIPAEEIVKTVYENFLAGKYNNMVALFNKVIHRKINIPHLNEELWEVAIEITKLKEKEILSFKHKDSQTGLHHFQNIKKCVSALINGQQEKFFGIGDQNDPIERAVAQHLTSIITRLIAYSTEICGSDKPFIKICEEIILHPSNPSFNYYPKPHSFLIGELKYVNPDDNWLKEEF